MLAVVGSEVGLLVAAGTTSVLALAFGLVNHGGRHDTRRHSNDGVTEYHDDARKEATDECDGRDVAITHGSEGNNRPIDAGADVGELSAGLPTFDDEHKGAEDGDKNEHKQEVNEYLTKTEPHALQEQIPLVDEGEELEHTEDTDESEHPEDEEITCTGEIGNEGQIERQCRQKVDNTKETERIPLTARRTIEAQQILDGEEESEDVLKNREHVFEASHDFRLGFNEGDQQAEDNGNHDRNVECLACRRVGIGDDIVEPWLVFQ